MPLANERTGDDIKSFALVCCCCLPPRGTALLRCVAFVVCRPWCRVRTWPRASWGCSRSRSRTTPSSRPWCCTRSCDEGSSKTKTKTNTICCLARHDAFFSSTAIAENKNPAQQQRNAVQQQSNNSNNNAMSGKGCNTSTQRWAEFRVGSS